MMSGDRRRLLFTVLVALICLSQLTCGVPRHIWRQDDIGTQIVNDPGSREKVLIASGDTDFKRAVIEDLARRFEPQGIYMKAVGLSKLEEEQPGDYGAVVIMDRCVAWGMDPRVDAFLKRHPDDAHMIVLTTSGGGDWLPDKKGRKFDAVSAASRQSDAPKVAGEIAAKIEGLLEAD
jgi:hypothetical protein